MYCDHSHGRIRPYIPKTFRRDIFNKFHNLSHPGIRATTKLITSQVVWPGINKDVHTWARNCLNCQKSKIHRHIKSPVASYGDPTHVLITLISI